MTEDTQSVYDPHAKCVSRQRSTTLVFHVNSDVLPDDEHFRVDTRRINSKGSSVLVIHILLLLMHVLVIILFCYKSSVGQPEKKAIT